MDKDRFTDGKYQNESADQRDAFEFYYSLGDNRKVKQIAEKYGKSERTIYEWSRRFNWTDRIVQYDIEVARKMKDKTISAVVDEKANYRKIIKLAIGDFVGRLRNGEVKVTSISDLEKLVKMDLVLMGEADGINENRNVNENTLNEEDRELIKDLAESIKKDLENSLN